MKIRLTTLLIGAIGGILMSSSPLSAAPKTGEELPIEVTADQSLEWYQDQKLYVARGKARAVKGSMVIEADILTAHQSDADKGVSAKNKKEQTSAGMGNIDTITAEGNVHIYDSKQQVFGDKAVYDSEQNVVQITGGNLRYLTANEIITARDSMEYYDDKGIAVARGRAVGISRKSSEDQRKVEADVLTAKFSTLPDGGRELTQLFADGHVTIVTKSDVSRGSRAVYDIKQNVAVMTGNVKITSNKTQLSGDKAEVDFNSGKSRLLNEGKGRVRAMLIPKSDSSASNKSKENIR